MRLEISNETPTKVPVIEAGIRRLKIVEAPKFEKVDAIGRRPAGVQMTVLFKVSDESADRDRETRDNILVSELFGKIRAKRLGLSAQVPFSPDGSFDTNDLIGKEVWAVVRRTDATDQTTGRATIYANIRDYITPDEPEYKPFN